jgi:hypothetical protein
MSSDDDKPDPIEDVRKGLGLLFRAAKTAAQKLPTKNLEEVVVSGAKEVGRAVENVANTIEKQVFGRDAAPSADAKAGDGTGQDGAKKPSDAPPEGGPRVDTGEKPKS